MSALRRQPGSLFCHSTLSIQRLPCQGWLPEISKARVRQRSGVSSPIIKCTRQPGLVYFVRAGQTPRLGRKLFITFASSDRSLLVRLLLLLLVWLGRGVHPDHLWCPCQGRRSSFIISLGLCCVLLYHQRDKKVVV